MLSCFDIIFNIEFGLGGMRSEVAVIGINTKVLCFDFKVGLDIGTNVFWPVFGDDLPVLSKNLRNERDERRIES